MKPPREDRPPELGQDAGSQTPCDERLVMCPPSYLASRIPNNVWMQRGKPVDRELAMAQWRRVKNVLEAMDIEVLEIAPVKDGQDQCFVANIAVAIDPYIVLANYKAPGREVEVPPARAFFRKHGYECIQPPYHFEGEAELKHLRDDLYFGGWGLFTDIKALQWIADTCEVEIIPIHEVNPKLYHLDCSILVMDEQNVIVTSQGIDKPSLAAIEKVANVIVTPPEVATTGVTNSVLLRSKNICLSGTFQPEQKEYTKAMEWMNTTLDRFGYTCIFLDVDSFEANAADISCCVMHLTF